MYKPNLRSLKKRIRRSVLPICLICALLIPLCPIYAAASPDNTDGDLPSDAVIWNGSASSDFAEGSGTRYDPYLISTAEELARLAQTVNEGNDYDGKYFKLTADLYLNDFGGALTPIDESLLNKWTPIGGYVSLSVNNINAYNSALERYQTLYLHTGKGFTPADRYVENAIYYHYATFNGHFDGDEHSIYGLYFAESQSCAGLFGACEDAEVTNLSLKNAYISGDNEIGGLIGRLDVTEYATIRNCTVDAQINAAGDRVGGLVGELVTHLEGASVTVTGCTASGELTADGLAGGLVGQARYEEGIGSLQIDKSTGSVAVSAKNSAGGIIGSLSLPSALLNSSSKGTLVADSKVGGIAGEIVSDSAYVTVSECQNDSAIVGQDSVGGIVGLCRAAQRTVPATVIQDEASEVVIELLSCANLGNLFGTNAAGGIVGSAETVDSAQINLIGCKNSASVNGTSAVGGIVGDLEANGGIVTVGASENFGAVTAHTLAGGIAGSVRTSAELTLYQCFSYASITAQNDYAGGIAGKTTVSENGSLLLELSCSNGTVKAVKFVGGIVGSQLTEASSAQSRLINCFSYAQMTAEENAGGIAGSLEASEGQIAVSNSLFFGTFTSGNKLTGGIAAFAHAQTAQAVVRIDQCYYLQSAAARPALLYGGSGSELCQSSSGLSEEGFKGTDQLYGLDFESVWQGRNEENPYPTLRSIEFIWENFRYSVVGKSASVIAYLGRSDIVTVPSKLGGATVTTIADSAFIENTLVKVILPDSVTTIGESAFADCKALRSITLSSALRAVGAGAFKNCDALEIRRAPSALTDLYTGSDNLPFNEAPIVQPIDLQTDFQYEDGSIAAKSGSITCYEDDYFLIEAPSITGYEADTRTLVGICRAGENIRVIYRLGSYTLTVRYLYPDGSEASENYVSSYRFGDTYSIPSPMVSGYLPANTILEGIMAGEDTVLTVYYSAELTDPDVDRSAHQSLLIILLICSSLAVVCCIGYFIFRYRSHHDKDNDRSDFEHLLHPRL